MVAAESTTAQKSRGNSVPRDLYARRWVTGTTFDGTRASLRVLDMRTGAQLETDFDGMARFLEFDVPTVKRKQLTFDLAQLRKIDVVDYAKAFGLPPWASSGQCAYSLPRRYGQLIIPCQLLAVSLFGITANARRRMLLPAGLEKQVKPRAAAYGRPKPEKPVFEWIREHLSARAAWASLYTSAIAGKLEMALPQAQVDASAKGVRSGKDVLVTRLTITTLRSDDHVLQTEQRSYRFSTPGTPRPMLREGALIHLEELAGLICTVEGLTDGQWDAVLPLLKNHWMHNPTRRVARRRLDSALRRYGQPCTWKVADVSSVNEKKSVANLIRRLKARDKWEELVERLWHSQLEDV